MTLSHPSHFALHHSQIDPEAAVGGPWGNPGRSETYVGVIGRVVFVVRAPVQAIDRGGVYGTRSGDGPLRLDVRVEDVPWFGGARPAARG